MRRTGWEQQQQTSQRFDSVRWIRFCSFGLWFLCCNRFLSSVMWSLRFPFFWSCVCHYVRFTTLRCRPFNMWFNLHFTVVSKKWTEANERVIILCLVFSFDDSSYYTTFSLSLHSSVFCCQQRGKNYKFPKLHYLLEQVYGLKKISYVRKINVQVCMFWQGRHLVKYASKEMYKIRKMVTFLYLPSLWPLWSVFAIQLHVIFYTFRHQRARLVFVFIKM